MKRLACTLVIVVLLLGFVGCSSANTSVSVDEIIAAYEDAGYTVFSDMYGEKLDEGEIGYIQAEHPNGDYIYISIFETEQEAKEYKKNYYHPYAMGLFSVIYGDPSWQRWQVHGCYVVQYGEPEFYAVFENLLKSK